ncbi:hypothetical protein PENSUB_10753 [Penicillium subrubescens]|uniref:Transcription factor domain-containing protein n=1 Tax=Penicillium subrubescens TaxID=1316194 RepID=A0A1Q5T8Q6_9EURO|nr:hypothetical protein PENSUB_10753 [Penicillium subrubescens]
MSRTALIVKAQNLLHSSIASVTDDQSEDDLQDLEPPPERDFTWDEVSDDDSEVSRIADDINGLAVSLDSLNSYNASYLGFSSVPTILRVIAHLSPRIRQVVPPSPETWKTSAPVGGSPESNASCEIDELSLINAYFLHVHPITPMIDEVEFRQRFADDAVPENHKTSWLALFNMVLAMGCFASGDSQFNTWAAATLGRPGLGYWDPGTVLTSSTSSLASMDYGTISLTANEQFCKIATRIQERLVEMPLITSDEIHDFDTELLKWKGSLHVFLSDAQHCPPPLRVARAMLFCRFMTTRLTLYRPYLLSAAIHRKQWSAATQQGGALVSKCLEIARDGVDTIASDWFPNHMLCWNHAWHLFQIALVLILAAVSDTNGAEGERCNEYILKSLDILAQMEPFDAGATRGRRVIQLLRDNIRNREDSIPMVDFDVSNGLVLDLLDEEMMGGDAEWVNFLCGYN